MALNPKVNITSPTLTSQYRILMRELISINYGSQSSSISCPTLLCGFYNQTNATLCILLVNVTNNKGPCFIVSSHIVVHHRAMTCDQPPM